MFCELSYTMVYRCFVIGAEVSCLLIFEGAQGNVHVQHHSFFQKENITRGTFFRFGNPNLSFHFVTVILGWWG